MNENDFSALGLSTKILENLKKKGITHPTSIQHEAFGPILTGKSLVGFSKTGTGKTLAYILPLYERMNQSQRLDAVQNLVLVPTRELAAQVVENFIFASGQPSQVVSIVGGESEDRQRQGIQNAPWVVATPGRLLDLLRKKYISLKSVRAIVFDEADRLLDMGFQDDMRDILSFIPKGSAQLLFFTATVHLGLEEMAYEFGIEKLERIGTETDQVTVEGLDHRVSFIGEEEKIFALANWLSENSESRGLVFSNYRDKASHVASRMRGLGCQCDVLTAQLPQQQRTYIMEGFKKGKIRVLIASDLAARGIDVFNLDFVINFDLPEDPATYVHRVGRTARAGKKGLAISFVGYEDAFRLEKIEKFLGSSIARMSFPTEKLSGRLPRIGSPVKSDPKPVVSNQKSNPVRVEPKISKGIWMRILEFFGFVKKEQKSVNVITPSRPRAGQKRFSRSGRLDRRRGGKRRPSSR
jgi:superfamily II DNA/RNA helicase